MIKISNIADQLAPEFGALIEDTVLDYLSKELLDTSSLSILFKLQNGA